MLDRLRADDPGFPAPNLDEWAADVAAMIREDGRTFDAMARLAGYALRDKFWKRVITSPDRIEGHSVGVWRGGKPRFYRC